MEENLCDTCSYHPATCVSDKTLFGIDKYPDAKGAEADIVIECDGYKIKQIEEGVENGNDQSKNQS